MATPLKNLSKLLSPRVLSPISPNFLGSLNTEIRKHERTNNRSAKRIDFSESSQKNYLNVPSSVKIKLNNKEFTGVEKHDILITSPNKQSIIRNGVGEEKSFNVLGRGSFGKVFKAIHKGRPAAMKLLKKTSCTREKNALRLNHANIIKTLEIFENEKETFSLVIMEFLPNCDTLQNILNVSTMTLRDLVNFALDICKGVEHCHSNKILHLDLKPSNILVFNGTCKICDFGNSVKDIENIDHFEHHGTVQYTAPEILLGLKPSEKSDVYSLGIIFWQLKTKDQPYGNIDNIESVIYQVVKCNLRPELKDECNDDYSRLYHQCWNQNYLERPTTSDILETFYTIEI